MGHKCIFVYGSTLVVLAEGGIGTYQSWVYAGNNGNAYVAGHFSSNPFVIGIFSVPLTGYKHVCVAKYHFTDAGMDEHKTENTKFSEK